MPNIDKQVGMLSRFLKGLPSQEKKPRLEQIRLELESGTRFQNLFHRLSPRTTPSTHCSGKPEGEIKEGGKNTKGSW